MRLKKIGLLCGMSWHSTKLYYDHINKYIADQFGSLYAANIVMNSLNSGNVLELLKNNKLEALKYYLLDECKAIERAGADYLAITCNTVHYCADFLQENLSIPIVSIIDAMKSKVIELDVKAVGIIATKLSIENKLYQNAFKDSSVETILPHELDIQRINDIIINLCGGNFLESDRSILHGIIKRIIISGAEAIILGCTELSLIIKVKSMLNAKILDSCSIHAEILSKLCHEDGLSLLETKDI